MQEGKTLIEAPRSSMPWKVGDLQTLIGTENIPGSPSFLGSFFRRIAEASSPSVMTSSSLVTFLSFFFLFPKGMSLIGERVVPFLSFDYVGLGVARTSSSSSVHPSFSAGNGSIV